MSESYLAALGRSLAFCAEAGDVSLERLVERAAWELHHETAGEISSLAFIVRRHDGSSFVGKPRELATLPAEILLGLLVEDGGSHVSYRVRDHALDTIRFLDARFRTSIVVRVALPKSFVLGGEGAFWFGLHGVATPKKVELAQTIANTTSAWFETYAPVVISLKSAHEHQAQVHERLLDMTSIAHDARAPLGALQYLLADLTAVHPEMQNDTARLRRELLYVDALLGKFSPREAQPTPTADEDTDACQVVQRVCERFVPEISAKGGRFVCVFPPRVPVRVRAPQVDFERIVSNVIGNAVRYAGKDEIRIEVAKSRSRVVQLLVSDRGPGFPRQVIDAVRLASTGSGRVAGAKGWGVGLISCKRRLTALGGDLVVESGSGGSVVTVSLLESRSDHNSGVAFNRVRPEVVSSAGNIAQDVDALAARSELVIIDDDTDHATSLERVLRRCQVQTRSFSTVAEALAHIRHAPHVRVVCDAHMPDGGAEKLLHTITGLGLPVACAVMSGDSSDDMIYRFAALGAREFFVKPASLDQLVTWATEPHRVHCSTLTPA
jgi:signal transduction histidine kinase/ActR/RegA family two-component response regulator